MALASASSITQHNTVASFTTNTLIDIDGNAEIVGDLGRQRTHLIYIIDIKLSMNKSVFGFEEFRSMHETAHFEGPLAYFMHQISIQLGLF